MNIRKYEDGDLPALLAIWNEVVEAGDAFPQEEYLDEKTGAAFFAAQSRTAAAEENGAILGLYILHPNNVGRCAHIANASYAVSSAARGKRVGEALVRDSLKNAFALGFEILQFNAVVESNLRARSLYERLGFRQLGTIPRGFRMKNGAYENICPYIYDLRESPPPQPV
ncbi:MAG: GNAT family N-acetyltransferase [Schwartzia sp.]|nr:GNAT family N-acetyltransferase [Schwartzia sp. (in: firmicutes)]